MSQCGIVDISRILRVPEEYIITCDSRPNYFEVAVRKDYIEIIKNQRKIPEFEPEFKFSEFVLREKLKLNDSLGSSWIKLIVTIIPKSDEQVIPLPRRSDFKSLSAYSDLSYSQILQYVSLTNAKNMWKDAYKKYDKKFTTNSEKELARINLISFDAAVRDIIKRAYGCSILLLSSNEGVLRASSSIEETHPNILSGRVAMETDEMFIILQDKVYRHTLQDCVDYSPAIFGDCYSKPLFVIYQLLHFMRDMHDRGLIMGNIKLADIYVSEELWIKVVPKLSDNIYRIPADCNHDSIDDHSPTFTEPKVAEGKDASYFCEMWVRGSLSNFDYLFELNKLAGRVYGHPRRHFVYPWITDFQSKNGLNWRDLTRSKFRLNKGDRQLDMTFDVKKNEMGVTNVPHHVSDILSEITYYAYKARVTRKEVLRDYVRRQWVPAEYPSSIQRLQQWTPDECIPEFYTDASVFKSIHPDLPDLGLPHWARTAEEFIICHRNLLESSYVSSRLHHWIDLTFGYKLSGAAAIKAKNVCLQLADKHTFPASSGVVQLFTQPHPQKLLPSLYLSKNPPPMPKSKIAHCEDSRVECDGERSKLLNASGSKNAPTQREQGLQETLQMPAGYNPISALIALEALHNFSYKVSGKIIGNERIGNNSISSEMFSDKSSGEKRNDKSFSGEKISDKAVRGGMLYDKSINGKQISGEGVNNKSFGGQRIYDKSISGERVNDNSISGERVNDKSFGCQRIHDKSISGERVNDKSNCKQKVSNKSVCCERISCKLISGEILRSNNDYNNLFTSQDVIASYKQVVASLRNREIFVVACLVVEIFMAEKLRGMIPAGDDFEIRLSNCRKVFKMNYHSIPKCVKYFLELLLGKDNGDILRMESVTDFGLPFPSAHQLVIPNFSSFLTHFPPALTHLYALHKQNYLFDAVEKYANASELRARIRRVRIAEFVKYVKILSQIETDLPASNFWMATVSPVVKNFLEDYSTRCFAATSVLDKIFEILGKKLSNSTYLSSVIRLYECGEECADVSKLYEKNFLLMLSIRLGLEVFLENIAPFVVRAIVKFENREDDSYCNGFTRDCAVTRACAENYTDPYESAENYTDLDAYTENYTDLDASTGNYTDLDASDGNYTNMDGSARNYTDLDESTSNYTNLDASARNYTDLDASTRNYTDLDASAGNYTDLDASTGNYTDLDAFTGNYTDLDECAGRMDTNSCNVSEEYVNLKNAITDNDINSTDFGVSNLRDDFVGSKIENQIIFIKNDFTEVSVQEIGDDLSLNSNERIAKVDEKVSEKCVSSNSGDLPELAKLAFDSAFWLAERVGPLNTSRHLTLPLLKAMTGELKKNTAAYEYLLKVANLYGEAFAINQYFAQICASISMCKVGTMSIQTENAYINSLNLFHRTIEYLSDEALNDLLEGLIAKEILHPAIDVVSSREVVFPSGCEVRKKATVALAKCLYSLGMKLGQRVSKSVAYFFLIFNVLRNIEGSDYYNLHGIIEEDECIGDKSVFYEYVEGIQRFKVEETNRELNIETARVQETVIFHEVSSKQSNEINIADISGDKKSQQMNKGNGQNISGKDVEQLNEINVPEVVGNNAGQPSNEINIDRITSNNASQPSNEINIAKNPSNNASQPSNEINIDRITSNNASQPSNEINIDRITSNNACQPSNEINNPKIYCNLASQPSSKIYMPIISTNKASQQLNGKLTPTIIASGEAIQQLRKTLIPKLAHDYYTLFARYFGESFMQQCVENMDYIRELCVLYEEKKSSRANKVKEYHFSLDNNRTYRMKEDQDKERHLAGNWLTYWKDELDRPKNFTFKYKQLKLQNYIGHTNAVKCVQSLESERSFFSASRDKTVKLWTLRNNGEGKAVTNCAFTYTGHQKSVLSAVFCERTRLIASSDSVVQLWDPFAGQVAHIIRSNAHINVLHALPAPYSTIIAANTNCNVNIIDTRVFACVSELKLFNPAAGLIRCIVSSSQDSNYVAVGLSTGVIATLDLRTGAMLSTWKAHEGEILQLIAFNDQLISTSLDQSFSVWNANDGRYNFSMKNASEPAHCLQLIRNRELISATTANKIGLHASISADASLTSWKIQSNIFRGVVSSMCVLPLNKMILLGSDVGAIALVA